jgi:CRISPR type IV-associated protein Csf1
MKNIEMTASYLFAKEKYNPGTEKCYYCGNNCGQEYLTKDYVKDTFTNRDIVHYPCSQYVCGCCMESMAGLGSTIQIDGTEKEGRGGAPRCYSWILTETKKEAFTKKHIDFARNRILNPPEPPFSIILADSGQKQLIFRAPINHDKNTFIVMLEEKEINVIPELLKIYLDTAVAVSAAIGKISLKEPDSFVNFKNVIEYYGYEEPLVEWIKIYSSPLGELAAWLCQGKEEANEYVIGRGFPQRISRDSRPVEEVAGDGRKGDQGRSNQIQLDFT